MNSLTDYFSGPQQQGDGMETMCADCQLTRTQRMYGFGLCFAAGFLISCLSSLLLMSGNFTGFAILYSFGNIISLGATGFLVGFVNQFKKMFDSTRIVATLVFLGALGCTLAAALALNNLALTIICCIIQYLALLWYSLSYIPFAHQVILSCCKGCLGG